MRTNNSIKRYLIKYNMEGFDHQYTDYDLKEFKTKREAQGYVRAAIAEYKSYSSDTMELIDMIELSEHEFLFLQDILF